MHKFFAWIGEFSVKFRWAIVAFWLALAVVATIWGPSAVTQNDNSNFLPDKAPSKHAIQLASPLQGNDTASVTVVLARDSKLTAQDQRTMAVLQGKLRHANSAVTEVRPPVASADGKAEQFTVIVKQTDRGPGQEALNKTMVTDMREAIASTPGATALNAHLAGQLADQVDQSAKGGSDQSLILIGSVVVILIILLIVFRALLAPFLTLIPAGLVVFISGPAVAIAAHNGLKVSSLATALMDVLVIGAGTDYGLFLVFRVREELEAGTEPKKAVSRAVARVGESIAFSAGTVIAALLSLLVASFQMYSTLGAPLAIGIGLMLLAGLTLTPALLAIFGRAVFWPVRPKVGVSKVGLWSRISSSVVDKPVRTLVGGVIGFGILAAFVVGYKPAGFGEGASAPDGSDSAAGAKLLQEHFPKASADPTQVVFTFAAPVWSNPTVLSAAETALAKNTSVFKTVQGPLSVGGTLSPSDLTTLHAANPAGLKAGTRPVIPAGVTPAAVQAYAVASHSISPDGRTAFFSTTLTAGDPSSTAALNATPAVRAAVTTVASQVHAVDSGVFGMSAIFYDISDISTQDLINIIPIAIVVIGLLLGLVLRSVVAPLYLIVSVALSYLAALGLSVLAFVVIGGSAGLIFFLPFMMFIFLLALGEDYNILVMTRIREEAHKKPLKEAVRDALNATGTTVTSAGLVLAGTFAVFGVIGATTGSSQFRDLGVGLTVGVLMDTFLVRTLLVPSTVILLGKWNWWPSKFSHDHQNEVAVPSGAELAD